jgi:methyl-accepting chemotaxis protein
MASETKTMNGLYQLPLAAFAVDNLGKICAWNQAAEELTGKAATETLKKPAWTAISNKRCSTAVEESFASGQTECQVVAIKGNQLTMVSTPTLDPDGEVSGGTVVFLTAMAGAGGDALSEGKLAAMERVSAVIEFELDGTIITANENFCAAMGYNLTEIKGRHHSMFAEPEYAASVEYKKFWKNLNAGEPGVGEFLRIAKGGREVWIQASYNPIFDKSGKPIRVVKFATDITKQVQERIDAKSNLAAIHRTQAVIEFNLDGTIITANENFLGALGYTLDEIVGKHHSMFVDPQYARSMEYAEFWRRLNGGTSDSGEYLRFGRGGKEVWIQASYNPILDSKGRAIKVVKFAVDVTAQVRMRQEAQRLQSIVENSPKPCMLLDLKDMSITYANPSAISMLASVEQYLPCRASEIVGKSVDIFHKNPSHQRRMLADERNLPHSARIKVGPETLQLQVYALRDASGKYTGPALAWEVITEQAKLEEADAKAKEVVKRVQVALEQLAHGDIQATINETFEGELEVMKENVNKIASVLQAFRQEARGLIDAATHGRLEERADDSRFQGAYGEIIRGINSIMDAIMGPVANIRQMLGRVAEGDLTAYVHEHYEGDHAALKDALNSSLNGLNGLLSQVKNAANQIATSAGQVSDAAQDLSQGASEQAATIEEISAQMVQMTNQTNQNAENASQANKLAVAARDGAEAGDRRMTEMVAAMRGIEEASNNISKIIKVIDEIAFQTNLLALNAAVEAARAGVHGKGFAVVAEEVRNLAARSARAAKETTEMIEGSIKKVTQGTGIAQETASALNRIVQDVGKVTDLVAEIAAASSEQAEGIGQINQGLEQVNEVTQRNTATAEESAASAEEMSGQTSEMRSMVDRFKLAEESNVGASGLDLPPELADAVQRYIAQLMGKTPPPATKKAAPAVAAPATPKKVVRGAKNDAEKVIALDSPEYGKY